MQSISIHDVGTVVLAGSDSALLVSFQDVRQLRLVSFYWQSIWLCWQMFEAHLFDGSVEILDF